jgi:hypothetical protein
LEGKLKTDIFLYTCLILDSRRAEAESMRMKASAYKQYGDAAIMALVLEALPKIAAEVAAPLAKTDEIVLISGSDRTTDEINKLVGSLPPAIQALTGVDLTGVSQHQKINGLSWDIVLTKCRSHLFFCLLVYNLHHFLKNRKSKNRP